MESLDVARDDLLGQTYRDVILTERLELWLRGSEGSRKLHALRSHNANRLLHPIPPPADVVERLEPVTWFLETVDAGVRLTAAGLSPYRGGARGGESPRLESRVDRPAAA